MRFILRREAASAGAVCPAWELSGGIRTALGSDGFPPGFGALPAGGQRGRLREGPAGTDGFVSGLVFDTEAAPSEKMPVLLSKALTARSEG